MKKSLMSVGYPLKPASFLSSTSVWLSGSCTHSPRRENALLRTPTFQTEFNRPARQVTPDHIIQAWISYILRAHLSDKHQALYCGCSGPGVLKC